jgi:acyl-CoA dehydrogenase
MSVASMELGEDYVRLRDRASEVGASLDAIAVDADESGRFVPAVRAALQESGLVTLTVPAAYGGRDENVDSLAVTVVREALAEYSSHADSMFAMQGIGSFALAKGGSESVKRQWLPRVATLDAVAALALTEPDVGSDLRALSTTIRVDGDDLVVSGHKSFITNAPDADFFCVLGKDDDGYSMALVPADSPGVTVTQPHQVISPHVLGDVVFDSVRVPAANRIGEPGKAFALVLQTLGTFRVSVAGAGIGIAKGALREALAYAQQRELFGTTLAKLGGPPEALARCWVEIETARSLAYRAAAASTIDPLANLNLASMAKIVGTETASTVADRCVQIMGRFGIVRGSSIERLYRASRPGRIYEGSTEVILESLSKQLARNGLT